MYTHGAVFALLCVSALASAQNMPPVACLADMMMRCPFEVPVALRTNTFNTPCLLNDKDSLNPVCRQYIDTHASTPTNQQPTPVNHRGPPLPRPFGPHMPGMGMMGGMSGGPTGGMGNMDGMMGGMGSGMMRNMPMGNMAEPHGPMPGPGGNSCIKHPGFPTPIPLPNLPFPFPGVPHFTPGMPLLPEGEHLPVPFQFPFAPPNFATFCQCDADRKQFCPNLEGPFTPSALFTSQCFKDNAEKLSPRCKSLYEAFHKGPTHFEVHVNIAVVGPCATDKAKFCPNASAGPWQVFTQPCMAENKDKLSPQCKAAFDRFTQAHTQGGIPPQYVPQLHVEIIRLPVPKAGEKEKTTTGVLADGSKIISVVGNVEVKVNRVQPSVPPTPSHTPSTPGTPLTPPTVFTVPPVSHAPLPVLADSKEANEEGVVAQSQVESFRKSLEAGDARAVLAVVMSATAVFALLSAVASAIGRSAKSTYQKLESEESKMDLIAPKEIKV